MKLEKYSEIIEFYNFHDTNPYIAYLCGFEPFKLLPSYSVFQRFIKNVDNRYLKEVMQSQVLKLTKLGFVDSSFISCDATPVFANTKQNNPKSFATNKFSKDNPPKSDPNCKLGVHTASNAHNEKIMNSIGDIKILFLLMLFLVYLLLKLLLLLISPNFPSPLIFSRKLINGSL
nr:hypothetical protein [Clostridium sp. Cult2]